MRFRSEFGSIAQPPPADKNFVLCLGSAPNLSQLRGFKPPGCTRRERPVRHHQPKPDGLTPARLRSFQTGMPSCRNHHARSQYPRWWTIWPFSIRKNPHP